MQLMQFVRNRLSYTMLKNRKLFFRLHYNNSAFLLTLFTYEYVFLANNLVLLL